MSNIHLGYTLSPAWNRDIPNPDSEATGLRYKYFLGDLLFQVGDFDASARWGWVPILDFALALSDITSRLESSGHEQVFEFTDSDASITFHPKNETVVIDPSYTPGTAEVSLGSLTTSSRGFLDSVLRDLIAHYPELANDEFVAGLLKPGRSIDK